VGLIARTLGEMGLAGGRLGFELGMEQRVNMPPAEFDLLRQALSAAEIVDGAPILWELRRRKSPREIAELRRACRATDAALIALFSGDRLGWSEQDAVRFCNSVAFQTGADDAGFSAVTSGRGDYNRGLAGARARRLERGDMLWIDFGVTCAGYWSDICRAGVVGGPTDDQRRLQEAVVAATWAGVEAIRPGVPIAEVARTVFARRDEIGGTSPIVIGRAGHSIGLRVTEIPHNSTTDPTILEPGMVITVEPFVFDEVGLYCAEEIVAVTEDGHEVLSSAPRELATI
jgi:Xaa-Pro aminopeptidase